MDWCKYNDCVIATGATDHSIKTWDVRMPQRELTTLLGHSLAVRRCCHDVVQAALPSGCLAAAVPEAMRHQLLREPRPGMFTIDFRTAGWCSRRTRRTSWRRAPTT